MLRLAGIPVSVGDTGWIIQQLYRDSRADAMKLAIRLEPGLDRHTAPARPRPLGAALRPLRSRRSAGLAARAARCADARACTLLALLAYRASANSDRARTRS